MYWGNCEFTVLWRSLMYKMSYEFKCLDILKTLKTLVGLFFIVLFPNVIIHLTHEGVKWHVRIVYCFCFLIINS